MQTRSLRKLLFENLVLKIISLALAVALFTLVRAEKRSLAYGTVRVSFTPPTGRLLVGEVPRQLQLSVLGPSSRIPRFRFEDLVAVNVDLSSVTPGYLKFLPEMIRLPRGFVVSSIRPAGLTVRYEQVVERVVPVRVTIAGQVSAGFRVVVAVAEPATVRIRGPERAFKALAELRTRPVVVEGAKSSLVSRVRLLPLPAGLSGDLPEEVTAQVEVGPVIPTVTLSAIPVVVDDPSQRQLTAEPAQLDVNVEGPAQVLANLQKSKLVARVTLAGSERGEVRVAPKIVGLPENVVVRKVTPAKVTVTLQANRLPLKKSRPAPAPNE